MDDDWLLKHLSVISNDCCVSSIYSIRVKPQIVSFHSVASSLSLVNNNGEEGEEDFVY